jgi:hypothetical protein
MVDETNLRGDELATVLTTYEVLGQRRANYDQMGWQTPALSFTAQAFLFSFALAPDATRFGRVLASLLALVISAASIQLMRKHLYLELIDAAILQNVEEAILAYRRVGQETPPHTRAETRRIGLTLESGEPITPGRSNRIDSPRFWTGALALFGVAALVIIVVEFAQPEWLS